MLILKYYARKYNPLCIMSSFHCVKDSGKENVNNAKKKEKNYSKSHVMNFNFYHF